MAKKTVVPNYTSGYDSNPEKGPMFSVKINKFESINK